MFQSRKTVAYTEGILYFHSCKNCNHPSPAWLTQTAVGWGGGWQWQHLAEEELATRFEVFIKCLFQTFWFVSVGLCWWSYFRLEVFIYTLRPGIKFPSKPPTKQGRLLFESDQMVGVFPA